MRVTICEKKCCGSGQCVLYAPDVFDQREDDGVVILLQENPKSELAERVHKAAEVCPTHAIEIED